MASFRGGGGRFNPGSAARQIEPVDISWPGIFPPVGWLCESTQHCWFLVGFRSTRTRKGSRPDQKCGARVMTRDLGIKPLHEPTAATWILEANINQLPWWQKRSLPVMKVPH